MKIDETDGPGAAPTGADLAGLVARGEAAQEAATAIIDAAALEAGSGAQQREAADGSLAGQVRRAKGSGDAATAIIDKDLTTFVKMAEAAGVHLSATAVKRARVVFNPSKLVHVDRIKLLTAALYTELEEVIKEADENGGGSDAKREAATAATHIQAGAMFAVSAATAHP